MVIEIRTQFDLLDAKAKEVMTEFLAVQHFKQGVLQCFDPLDNFETPGLISLLLAFGGQGVSKVLNSVVSPEMSPFEPNSTPLLISASRCNAC